MKTRIPGLTSLIILVFALLATASLKAYADGQQGRDIYTFAVVPQQSATRLAQDWVPILQYISEKTGLNVRFQTAKDIPTFESLLARGEYDFAYMNPFHYVTFHQNPGYLAFAHQSDKKIKGIMVKQTQSSLSSLKELDGEVLSFPSPKAFAASLLPRGELKKQGVDITPQYVGSHDSVYRSVAKGIYPAGGGIVRTFNTLPEEIKSQLDVFWISEGYTPHAFAAHPRVPVDVVAKVAGTLTQMKEDPEGMQLLSRIKFKGIQPAVDADWNDVRQLAID